MVIHSAFSAIGMDNAGEGCYDHGGNRVLGDVHDQFRALGEFGRSATQTACLGTESGNGDNIQSSDGMAEEFLSGRPRDSRIYDTRRTSLSDGR